MTPLIPVVQHTKLFQPVRTVMPEGMTIEEIIESSGVHERFWDDGVVTIDRKDGKDSAEIPREWWSHVRPRTNGIPIEVSLWLPPAKGAGNILSIVATIAIIVAATFVAGPAGTAFFTSLGFAAFASTAAAVAGAGVALLGSLAIRALTPPPSTQALTEGSGIDSQDRIASIDQNILRPGGIIPHTRGTRKIYAPVVVKLLIELVGDHEYATIVLGMSGAHAISDLRADNVEFDRMVELGELEYEVRDIVNDDSLITLIERQSATDPNVITMSQHEVDITNTKRLKDQTTPLNSSPTWHAMRSDGSPDEIWLHFRWPGGLFDADVPTAQMVTPVRVRIRPVGDVAWIRLPEVHFAYKKQEMFRKDIRIIWGTAPSAPTPKTDRAPYTAYAAVVQKLDNGGTASVIGDFTAPTLENLSDHNDLSGVSKSGSTASGYVGFRDDNHPRRAIKSQVGGDNSTGFTSAANVTVQWWGKSTPGAPANDTDGTLLATTGSIADTTSLQELTSSDQTTLFYSQWIKTIGSVAGSYALRRWDLFDDGDWSWISHSSFYTSILSSAVSNWVMRDTTIGTTVVRNTALYEDRAEFYLDPVTFPQGDYEIEIMRGAVVDQAGFTEATYINNDDTQVVADLFKWRWNGGANVYEVPRDMNNVQYQMQRVRLVRIWNEHPLLNAPGKLSLIALKVKDRQVQQISCIAQKYVPDWDGSIWTGNVLTNNPAPHAVDALIGELNADAAESDLIDNASFVAWRTQCVTDDREINAVIEGQSAETVSQLAAGAGYARIGKSETFRAIIDKDRSAEAPVQIFSSRNSNGYQYRVDYPRRPSGFRVVFNDIDQNYNENEIIVMDPDGDQGAIFEEARYDALVTLADVTERALFDMKQSRLRGVLHSFDANGQSIKCVNGDLIGLNNPVLRRQFGAGYIQRIIYSSPATHIIGLELDGTVPINGDDGLFLMPYTDDDAFIDESIADGLWGPLSIGACVRLKNGGGWLTAEIVTNELVTISRTITFTTPQLATNVDVGGLVTVGELGEEYLRLILREMVPKAAPSYPATLIAFDEAQELWS